MYLKISILFFIKRGAAIAISLGLVLTSGNTADAIAQNLPSLSHAESLETQSAFEREALVAGLTNFTGSLDIRARVKSILARLSFIDKSTQEPAMRWSGKGLTEKQHKEIINRAIKEHFPTGSPIQIKDGWLMDWSKPEYQRLDPDGSLRIAGIRVFFLEGLNARILELGLKSPGEELITDLVTHPGRTRGHFYVDASLYPILAGQTNEWLGQWARHELFHIQNPAADEDTIQKMAPIPRMPANPASEIKSEEPNGNQRPEAWLKALSLWVHKNGEDKNTPPLLVLEGGYEANQELLDKLRLPLRGFNNAVLEPVWESGIGYVIHVSGDMKNPLRRYLIGVGQGQWLRPITDGRLGSVQGTIGHLLEGRGPVDLNRLDKEYSTYSGGHGKVRQIEMAMLPTIGYRIRITLPVTVKPEKVRLEIDAPSLATSVRRVYILDAQTRDLLTTVDVDMSNPSVPKITSLANVARGTGGGQRFLLEEQEKRAEIRRKEAAQFKAWREALRVSKNAFANRLGLDGRTLFGYETGLVHIPAYLYEAARTMSEGGSLDVETPSLLERQAAPPKGISLPKVTSRQREPSRITHFRGESGQPSGYNTRPEQLQAGRMMQVVRQNLGLMQSDFGLQILGLRGDRDSIGSKISKWERGAHRIPDSLWSKVEALHAKGPVFSGTHLGTPGSYTPAFDEAHRALMQHWIHHPQTWEFIYTPDDGTQFSRGHMVDKDKLLVVRLLALADWLDYNWDAPLRFILIDGDSKVRETPQWGDSPMSLVNNSAGDHLYVEAGMGLAENPYPTVYITRQLFDRLDPWLFQRVLTEELAHLRAKEAGDRRPEMLGDAKNEDLLREVQRSIEFPDDYGPAIALGLQGLAKQKRRPSPENEIAAAHATSVEALEHLLKLNEKGLSKGLSLFYVDDTGKPQRLEPSLEVLDMLKNDPHMVVAFRTFAKAEAEFEATFTLNNREILDSLTTSVSGIDEVYLRKITPEQWTDDSSIPLRLVLEEVAHFVRAYKKLASKRQLQRIAKPAISKAIDPFFIRMVGEFALRVIERTLRVQNILLFDRQVESVNRIINDAIRTLESILSDPAYSDPKNRWVAEVRNGLTHLTLRRDDLAHNPEQVIRDAQQSGLTIDSYSLGLLQKGWKVLQRQYLNRRVLISTTEPDDLDFPSVPDIGHLGGEVFLPHAYPWNFVFRFHLIPGRQYGALTAKNFEGIPLILTDLSDGMSMKQRLIFQGDAFIATFEDLRPGRTYRLELGDPTVQPVKPLPSPSPKSRWSGFHMDPGSVLAAFSLAAGNMGLLRISVALMIMPWLISFIENFINPTNHATSPPLRRSTKALTAFTRAA